MQFFALVEGNLTDSPRTGVAKNGDPWSAFTIMHTTQYRSRGEWVDGRTIALQVTCWRTLARNVANLHKGDTVVVELNSDLEATVYNERGYLRASARNVSVSARFRPAAAQPRQNQQPEHQVIAETGGYDTHASDGYVEPTATPEEDIVPEDEQEPTQAPAKKTAARRSNARAASKTGRAA